MSHKIGELFVTTAVRAYEGLLYLMSPIKVVSLLLLEDGH
jgi:hypothetical protein